MRREEGAGKKEISRCLSKRNLSRKVDDGGGRRNHPLPRPRIGTRGYQGGSKGKALLARISIYAAAGPLRLRSHAGNESERLAVGDLRGRQERGAIDSSFNLATHPPDGGESSREMLSLSPLLDGLYLFECVVQSARPHRALQTG